VAYNTKNIIRDVAGAPVPQFYNPASDTYEALQGRNGANRVELYGPDGNPIGTTSGKLNVRASEIEALTGALADVAVTDPAASASIIALLKGLLKQHQGGGTIKDQVDVVDRAARALGKITADDNAIAALGALAAAAVTDPAASASVIALLKGLLKQLQGTGTGAAPVQLTGRRLAVGVGNYDQVLNVAVGGTTTITITPSTGELWRLQAIILSLSAPAGATSGTHTLYVVPWFNTYSIYRVLEASSNYGDGIQILYNYIKDATAGKYPTTEQAQQAAIQGLVVTNSAPLYIKYANSTNATQSGTLTVRVVREVEYIV